MTGDSFVLFDPKIAASPDPQAPYADNETLAKYDERLAAGMCPMCQKPYGVTVKERHKLPRVDGEPGRWQEPTWVFLGPCGHRVMAIGKNSPLARRYRLVDG